jgi:hypothetical protein
MAKQKFRPTRLGGFSGAKAYIRYVEVLKKHRNAVQGRTFCDAIKFQNFNLPLTDLMFLKLGHPWRGWRSGRILVVEPTDQGRDSWESPALNFSTGLLVS